MKNLNKIRHNVELLDKNNPFENCKLDRQQYAETLTQIITKYSDGFVLALNNKWGTGKTTFVKMWDKYLQNNNFKTLYYNAWENDFENDVLISIISELKKLNVADKNDIFNKIIKKAAPLTKAALTSFFKHQVKKHIGEDFTKEILENSADPLADSLVEQIQSFAERRKSIQELRKVLDDYVKQVSKNLPIVFIIDELDRCRPSFAVEVLEQIKHLFSVPGIVFVLSIDKEQLCHAIKGYYGSEKIDSNEYLRRFIDIEFSLPEPEISLFCSYMIEFYNYKEFLHCNERMRYREFQTDMADIIDFSTLLFNSTAISLRMQEKIFAHARLSMCLFKANDYLIPYTFLFLTYLKFKNPEVLNNIHNLSFSLQDFVNTIEEFIPNGLRNKDQEIFTYMESHLIKYYHNSLVFDYLNNNRKSQNLFIKENDENKSLAIKTQNNQRIFDLISSFERQGTDRYSLGIINITSKIKLLDPFNVNN